MTFTSRVRLRVQILLVAITVLNIIDSVIVDSTVLAPPTLWLVTYCFFKGFLAQAESYNRNPVVLLNIFLSTAKNGYCYSSSISEAESL